MFSTSTRSLFSRSPSENRARFRRSPARAERSRDTREIPDRAARSVGTSFWVILQCNKDSLQANNNCLQTTCNHNKTRPIENREASYRLNRCVGQLKRQREPSANVQRNHPPRLRHDSAKLTLSTNCLSEKSDVSGQHRQNCGPISDQWIHQPAVRDANENDDVGNAVGQIVQNFATDARLLRSDRDHSIEHADPEPQIAKQRRNNQEPPNLT